MFYFLAFVLGLSIPYLYEIFLQMREDDEEEYISITPKGLDYLKRVSRDKDR